MSYSTPSEPDQVLPVYSARDLIASDGANLGDPLGLADDLIAGDVYQLSVGVERASLALTVPDEGAFLIAPETEAGHVGASVALDSCVTFMSPDGAVVEALLLVEHGHDDHSVCDLHVYSLAEMSPRVAYAVVAIDRDAAHMRFAEAACVSFTQGTHITMANGSQRAIEELGTGDRVLTRDHGVQPIRWIGQRTVRAHGAFAPIRIRQGTLNNSRDLIVSPNHRLFVYQRSDQLGVGRAEVLVRAKHLLDGEAVTQTAGGFVDYYQILFDRHEIIYAEGIAVETFLVDHTTRSALPHDVPLGGNGTGNDRAVELNERHLRAHRAAEILRKASVG
ncbi:Hint domain-containing protein [Palleronia sp.]|uniref:Hint domain-containing protein n=1 Tax=Palleronia sp. TaxID=1940284 RepID=UPI0035C7DB49